MLATGRLQSHQQVFTPFTHTQGCATYGRRMQHKDTRIHFITITLYIQAHNGAAIYEEYIYSRRWEGGKL